MLTAKNKFLWAAFALATLFLIGALAGPAIIFQSEQHKDFLLIFATFLLVLATILLALVVVIQLLDARLSSERQLRAYVFVEEAKISRAQDKWVITCRIRNFGQTPAHAVSLQYAAEAVVWPHAGKPKLRTLGDDDTENLGSMGPRRGNFEKDDDVPFTDTTFEQITSHAKAIFLHGVITYETVFGKSFSTNFRYYVGGDMDWDDDGEMNADEVGNDAN